MVRRRRARAGAMPGSREQGAARGVRDNGRARRHPSSSRSHRGPRQRGGSPATEPARRRRRSKRCGTHRGAPFVSPPTHRTNRATAGVARRNRPSYDVSHPWPRRCTLEVRERPQDWQRFADRFNPIERNVERVVRGKDAEIRLALVALIAEGHLLIEDVPGVGKTMLAKAVARSIDCSFRRIQFTPDLLPTDVTGVNVFNQEQHDFEFKPGAIFANIVLGDEINRASPKTQSALLESMEERQVTVDTVTHTLGTPFIVIATQNPVEHEGTYPLPEAQLDRFMMRLSVGYPSAAVEAEILASHTAGEPLAEIRPVCDA